jgi:hypothetical protein
LSSSACVFLIPRTVDTTAFYLGTWRLSACCDILIAVGFESTVFSGHAAHATGAVAAAEGHVEEALSSLNIAREKWQTADMPYEEAQTRLLMATVYWRVGEADLAEPKRWPPASYLSDWGPLWTWSVPTT